MALMGDAKAKSSSFTTVAQEGPMTNQGPNTAEASKLGQKGGSAHFFFGGLRGHGGIGKQRLVTFADSHSPDDMN
jgi:hypothetical protein